MNQKVACPGKPRAGAARNPTIGTYVNEIGGYVIAGIIAVAIGLYLLVSGDSTPETSQQQSDNVAHEAPVVSDHKAGETTAALEADHSPTKFNMSLRELSRPIDADDSQDESTKDD